MEAQMDLSSNELRELVASPATGNGPAILSRRLLADHRVTMAWEHINYRVLVDNKDAHERDPANEPKKKFKTLLYDMSGIARPGRVLAIMGPSGAGKTTLMSALSGRLTISKKHILDGTCTVNGVTLTKDLEKLMTVVAQDDIVMGRETPRDAFRVSGRLRMGLDAAETENLVEDTISMLHINRCADRQIGIPGVLVGISSSERKRVNIGCELISNPFVMILDEPTTGLDSVNASRIGQIIRDLAHDSGRTVICTLHSPSSELFNMFDDLLLLAKGHVIYHGPRPGAVAHFASVGRPVPPRTNPTEYYLNLLQLPDEELEVLWDAWAARVATDSSNDCTHDYPSEVPGEHEILAKKCEVKSCGIATQFLVLYRRSLRMYLRDRFATVSRLIQTVYIALLFGLFFFNVDKTSKGVRNMSGILYMISINQVFLAVMPALITFSSERAVFMQEQSNRVYQPSIYVITKIMAETPFNLFFPIIFSCILYYMVGLRSEASAFFIFIFINMLLSMCSFAFGLCVSAIFPSLDAALGFAPLLILPLSIVAGMFANTERLDPYFLWLAYISFPRYNYGALVDNEFRGRSLCPSGSMGCTYHMGDEYLKQIGFDDWHWQNSVWMFLVMTIAFWIIAVISLTIVGYRRRSSLTFNRNCKETANSPDNFRDTETVTANNEASNYTVEE